MAGIHIQGRLKLGNKNFPEENEAALFVLKKREKDKDHTILLRAIQAYMEMDGVGWHPPQNITSAKVTKQMLSILEQMENAAKWLDDAKLLTETLKSIDWTNVRYVNGNPVEDNVIEQLTALDHSAKHMLGDAIFFDEDE